MFSCIELTDGEPNNAMMPGQMFDEDSVIFRLLIDAKSDSSLELASTALTQTCKEGDQDFREICQAVLPERLHAVKSVLAVLLNYHPERE